jgi:hypothetical protein
MKLSISGLGRVEKCPASVVLSKTFGRESKYARRGNMLHSYLYLVSTVGAEAALELMPLDEREACAAVELERLPAAKPESYAAEVAFAFNWRTGTARELGRGLDRAYDCRVDEACEIPGTADVVGLTPTHVIVLDYKSGWADLGDVANNLQLLGLGLAAARAYGREDAFVGILRLRPDGTPWFDVVELGPMELDAAEVRIRGICEAAEKVRLAEHFDVQEGLWCRHCAAFDSCPAKVRLAASLAYPARVQDSIPTLTVESVPAVLDRLAAIKEVVARVEDSVREFARVNPVPLPGGKVYGAVQVVEESPMPLEGAAVLREKFGEAAAVEALVQPPPKMSWASIERGLRAHMREQGLTRGIDELKRAAREALRAAGAVEESRSVQVKIHKPKMPVLPAGEESAPKNQAG